MEDSRFFKINDRGYSLLELILVLALFSIIFSIGLPKSSAFRNIMAKSEITELRKDLIMARNSAIIENQYYDVVFEPYKNRYIINKLNSNERVKIKEFIHGIKLEKESNAKRFTFNPNGSTGNSDSLFLIDQRGRRIEISLTPATGRISFYYY